MEKTYTLNKFIITLTFLVYCFLSFCVLGFAHALLNTSDVRIYGYIILVFLVVYPCYCWTSLFKIWQESYKAITIDEPNRKLILTGKNNSTMTLYFDEIENVCVVRDNLIKNTYVFHINILTKSGIFKITVTDDGADFFARIPDNINKVYKSSIFS